MKIAVVFAAGAAALALAAPVLADGVYHSQHFPLHAIGGAPLDSGFLENIHANGQVYAHQQYHLNGAAPNTTYHGVLEFFLFDPTCSTAPTDVPTATFTPNGVGNGNGDAVFPLSTIPPVIHGVANGEVFELLAPDGTVAYSTDCTSGMFD